LGGRKGIRPVKKLSGGLLAWFLKRGADLHMAQLMPLPLTVSCFRKIQLGFTFRAHRLTWVVPENGRSTGARVCVCFWFGEGLRNAVDRRAGQTLLPAARRTAVPMRVRATTHRRLPGGGIVE